MTVGLVPGVPPVSFLRTDDVHQISLPEAQVVVRLRVVVVLGNVKGDIGLRGLHVWGLPPAYVFKINR